MFVIDVNNNSVGLAQADQLQNTICKTNNHQCKYYLKNKLSIQPYHQPTIYEITSNIHCHKNTYSTVVGVPQSVIV